jgi:ATP-dependent Lon protease
MRLDGSTAEPSRKELRTGHSIVYLQPPDLRPPGRTYHDYAGLLPRIIDAVREAGAEDPPMPVALRGASGSGKTSLADAVARALGKPAYSTQGTPDCSAQDLIVFPVPTSPRRFDAVASGIFSAFVEGGVAIFDEIGKVARHTPESLAPLASMLDHRRTVFSDFLKESFRAAPGFAFICTLQNDESLPEYLTKRMVTFTIPPPSAENVMEIVKANVPFAQPALVTAFRDLAVSALRPVPREGGNILNYAHRMAGDRALTKTEAEALIREAIRAITGRGDSP